METPAIASSLRASTAYNMDEIVAGAAPRGLVFGGPVVQRRQFVEHINNPTPEEIMDMATPPTRRMVQVFIADTNDNVPLDDCLVYKGEPKMTDLTDQELFFEVDIKALLATHNTKRVTFIDKKVKERVEHLEPVRIKDLKMTVVTVAAF